MKLTADTNVLVRAVTGDDARQSKIAQAALSGAEAVVVTLAALCELVWVLSRGHKIALAEVAEAIRRLVNSANVVVNRPAVEAGLASAMQIDALSGAGTFQGGYSGNPNGGLSTLTIGITNGSGTFNGKFQNDMNARLGII